MRFRPEGPVHGGGGRRRRGSSTVPKGLLQERPVDLHPDGRGGGFGVELGEDAMSPETQQQLGAALIAGRRIHRLRDRGVAPEHLNDERLEQRFRLVTCHVMVLDVPQVQSAIMPDHAPLP